MQLRSDLADCYERLGANYAAVGDKTSAREWYAKSVEVWKNWTKWGLSSAYNIRREKARERTWSVFEPDVSSER